MKTKKKKKKSDTRLILSAHFKRDNIPFPNTTLQEYFYLNSKGAQESLTVNSEENNEYENTASI